MRHRNTSISLRASDSCCHASADGTDHRKRRKASLVAESDLTGSPTGPISRNRVGGRGNNLGSSVDSTLNVDRRSRKIRRTGRHTTPSQVEKVAEKAGKAAPVVAIAGVLVAAPQAHAAVRTPAKATSVAVQVRTDAHTVALVTRAQPATRSYTVRSGDSLSTISERFYGSSANWRWIYFFQAEDGIRDSEVTGVQTCALPIWSRNGPASMPSSPHTTWKPSTRCVRS